LRTGEHRESIRNVDIRAFLPTIEHILALGGKVVRLGDPTATPLPKLEGLIDYAHAEERSEALDIFFCAEARIFVGTAAGPQSVAPLFNVPLSLSNWCVLARPPWGKDDVFVPKLIWSDRLNRVLTLDEMVTPPFRFFDGETVARHRARLIDNTPDEILGCLRQRLLELEHGRQANPATDALHVAVTAALAAVDIPMNSRISDDFLSRHRAELFPHLADPGVSEPYGSPHHRRHIVR
jgi:putative glycosyltransferase (TIGR04372 family)